MARLLAPYPSERVGLLRKFHVEPRRALSGVLHQETAATERFFNLNSLLRMMREHPRAASLRCTLGRAGRRRFLMAKWTAGALITGRVETCGLTTGAVENPVDLPVDNAVNNLTVR